jgi:DNA-binding protein H-NS
MARPRSLAKMSLDALVQLRTDVTEAISHQADALRAQLASLTGSAPNRGRAKVVTRKSKLASRKVPPKYRDKAGNTWSGRGAQPRWMTAAIKGGAKRDDFLIAKRAPAAKRKTRR